MDKIYVSVIVPIYNVADYLSECLESLERQTLKDIEVILVNDGSTDNSGDIAEIFADRNANFKLINRVNGGLSAARNTGLENAHGEYVYFLDSDDFLADNALEKLYFKATKDNLDQIRFVAYSFEDGTKDYKWSEIDEGGYKYRGDYPDVYSGLVFFQKTIDNNDYYPSCCLIFTRRSVIESSNLRFYEGILHEDNLFNFQLTTICKRVALLHEPLYYRRYRLGSITQECDWLKKNKAMCISVIEADKYVEAHPKIKGKTSDWMINFFINTMLGHWEHMTREKQNSQESKDYFERVKPLAKKYGMGKSIKLFYVSYSLYRIYMKARHIVGKVIHRS